MRRLLFLGFVVWVVSFPVAANAAVTLTPETCSQYGSYTNSVCTLNQHIDDEVILPEDFFALDGAGYQVASLRIAADYVTVSELLVRDIEESNAAITIEQGTQGVYLDTIVATGEYEIFIDNQSQDVEISHVFLQGNPDRADQSGIVSQYSESISVTAAHIVAGYTAVATENTYAVTLDKVHAVGTGGQTPPAFWFTDTGLVTVTNSSIANWLFDIQRYESQTLQVSYKLLPRLLRMVIPVAYAQGLAQLVPGLPGIGVENTAVFDVTTSNVASETSTVPDPRAASACALTLPEVATAGDVVPGTVSIPDAGRALVTGVGKVEGDGSFTVSPSVTTVYSAYVWDALGQVRVCVAQVAVSPVSETASGTASTTGTATNSTEPWYGFIANIWSWFFNDVLVLPDADAQLESVQSQADDPDDTDTSSTAAATDEEEPLHVRAARNAASIGIQPFGYKLGAEGWDMETKQYVSSSTIMSGYSDNSFPGQVTRGLDCSGLIMWAYNYAYDPYAPVSENYIHTRKSTAQASEKQSYAVSQAELRPGDILSFGYGTTTVNHVAMYVGDIGAEYGVDAVMNAGDYDIGIDTYSLAGVGVNKSSFKGFHRPYNTDIDVRLQLHSPVDLILTTPSGAVLTKDTYYVGYSEAFFGLEEGIYYNQDIIGVDGLPDDLIYGSFSPGEYQIQVVPHVDAASDATYSLTLQVGGGDIITIVNEQPVRDIPPEGFKLTIPESVTDTPDLVRLQSLALSAAGTSASRSSVSDPEDIDYTHYKLSLLRMQIDLLTQLLAGQVSFQSGLPVLEGIIQVYETIE